ncbi:hypothetical protein Nm8I071_23940 [Nonomuraea sp. TT08I-71]|nr:hypothetical protein Nm8I071_23940 [Nonomuraea sp. TT08I-71]
MTRNTSRPCAAPHRAFARHYLEMLVAMAIGVLPLYPRWKLATSGHPADWLHRADIDSLAMATTMVAPMARWMRFRGHITAGGGDVPGDVCRLHHPLPLLWLGASRTAGLAMLGHVLMLVLMLGAVIARYREYSHSRRPDLRPRT